MRVDVKYVHNKINQAGGLPQIHKAVSLIQNHVSEKHLTSKNEIFTTKNQRLACWKPNQEDIYNLVVSMFTTALTSEYLTYQAMVSIYQSNLPMTKTADRVKTVAEVVAMLCLADLIDINSVRGEYHTITASLKLKNIPTTDKHGTIYEHAQPVESNHDPEQGRMILGGKVKYHDGNICLDHINRLNKIPLQLNKEFLLKYPEEPKKKIKEGEHDKQEVWDTYKSVSRRKYAYALAMKQPVFINHKSCSRGRCYAVGYYINYQGTSYKKASLQFANKEYLK